LTRIAGCVIVATNIATWRDVMKFANVRELKNKTSEVLRNAEKEAVIITSKGKPRAIVTAISEEDFEDYLLEKSDALHDMLAEAQAEYRSKGGVSTEDYASRQKTGGLGMPKNEIDKAVSVAKKYGVVKLFLIGSSLTREKKFVNDYDFAVSGLPKGSFFKFYGELFRTMSKNVDLIDLSGKKTKFKNIILKEGLLIYEKKAA